MKKGKLSKIEVFFINNNPNKSNEEIAAELDRSVEVVTNNRVVPSAAPTKELKPMGPYMDMVRGKNRDGQSSGVIVSTQASAEVADASAGMVITKEGRTFNENSSGSNRYTKNVGKVFRN